MARRGMAVGMVMAAGFLFLTGVAPARGQAVNHWAKLKEIMSGKDMQGAEPLVKAAEYMQELPFSEVSRLDGLMAAEAKGKRPEEAREIHMMAAMLYIDYFEKKAVTLGAFVDDLATAKRTHTPLWTQMALTQLLKDGKNPPKKETLQKLVDVLKKRAGDPKTDITTAAAEAGILVSLVCQNPDLKQSAFASMEVLLGLLKRPDWSEQVVETISNVLEGARPILDENAEKRDAFKKKLQGEAGQIKNTEAREIYLRTVETL